MKRVIAAILIATSMTAVNAGFIADIIKTTVKGGLVVVAGTAAVVAAPFYLVGAGYEIVADDFAEDGDELPGSTAKFEHNYKGTGMTKVTYANGDVKFFNK